MTINYTNNSIFDIDAEAIVNPVNCVGVSGAGLALQFRLRYPENDRVYRQNCRLGRLRPGSVLVTDAGLDSPKYIVNFPTKRHWRDSSRLDDIRLGLRRLREELLRREIRSVALPALGAGLGGLSWDAVKREIEREMADEGGIETIVCLPVKGGVRGRGKGQPNRL